MIWKIAFRHLLAKPLSGIMTLVAVAVSLAFLGLFWTLVENLERIKLQSAAPSEQPSISVFMNPSLSSGQLDSVKSEMKTDERISGVEVVSSNDSLKSLENQFGETLSKAFAGETLPIVFKIQVKNSQMTRDDYVELMNKLRSFDGVLDVDDGMSLVPAQKSNFSSKVFSWTGVLLLVVFFVVALLISHLIRLAFEAGRSEIETMKVVGAPKRWMFFPMLIEGLALGVGGAIASLFILSVAVQWGFPRMAALLLPKGVVFEGFSFSVAAGLFALGIAASVVGALMTWPLVSRPAEEL